MEACASSDASSYIIIYARGPACRAQAAQKRVPQACDAGNRGARARRLGAPLARRLLSHVVACFGGGGWRAAGWTPPRQWQCPGRPYARARQTAQCSTPFATSSVAPAQAHAEGEAGQINDPVHFASLPYQSDLARLLHALRRRRVRARMHACTALGACSRACANTQWSSSYTTRCRTHNNRAYGETVAALSPGSCIS